MSRWFLFGHIVLMFASWVYVGQFIPPDTPVFSAHALVPLLISAFLTGTFMNTFRRSLTERET